MRDSGKNAGDFECSGGKGTDGGQSQKSKKGIEDHRDCAQRYSDGGSYYNGDLFFAERRSKIRGTLRKNGNRKLHND